MHCLHRVYLAIAAVVCAACAGYAQEDDTALINDLPAAKADQSTKGEGKRSATQRTRTRGDAGAADAPPADILPRVPGKSPPSAADRTTLINDTAEQRGAEHSTQTKTSAGIPENLADALSLALNRSPGIVVAEAKVRQAEAELSEVRQSVVEELTIAYQQWEMEKKSLALMVKKGRISAESMPLGMVKQEARILYLLGAGGRSRLSGVGHARPSHGMPPDMAFPMGGMMAPSSMNGAMMGGMPGDPWGAMMGGPGGMPMGAAAAPASDREQPAKSAAAPRAASAALPNSLRNISAGVRGFLQTRTDMDFHEQPFADVLAYLESVAKSEVTFVSLPGNLTAEKQPSVTIRLKQVTIASALEALSDLYGYAFVFRDYGILVIEPANRGQIGAFRNSGVPMIAPPDGTTLPTMGGPMGSGAVN